MRSINPAIVPHIERMFPIVSAELDARPECTGVSERDRSKERIMKRKCVECPIAAMCLREALIEDVRLDNADMAPNNVVLGGMTRRERKVFIGQIEAKVAQITGVTV